MFESHCEAAVERQRVVNRTAAQQAVAFAAMDLSREHEALGFSSVVAWARATLHLHPDEIRGHLRVGRALRELPQVRQAALAGDLTLRHLLSFDYAVRIVGRSETVEAESALLEVAAVASAEEFHGMLRRMREASLDALDHAWQRGMDKHDLTLAKTLEGWQIAGFLPIHVGAKLKAVLDSVATPRAAGDPRSPATRRIDGLETLCDATLAHGLPSDNGIKPHLRIVIDVDHELGQTQATLAKFGPIGPALAAHLACDAEWLTIKTRNHDVLDVGRRHRYATPKQTEAILLIQDGTCAGPGCHHRIAHIHHQQPWSQGGHTNLDNLTGYCNTCHTLEHLRLNRQPALPRAG